MNCKLCNKSLPRSTKSGCCGECYRLRGATVDWSEYDEEISDQPDKAPTAPQPTPEAAKASKLSFGKHKWKSLSSIPMDYLKWLLDEKPRLLKPGQLNEIRQILGIATTDAEVVAEAASMKKPPPKTPDPRFFGGETVAEPIQLSFLAADADVQGREEINLQTVEEYAEAMGRGDKFPPLICCFDGATYWLADGFHRRLAYQRANITIVQAELRQGTKRDAILHSAGANATHGLRRTNQDKRKSVLRLLGDAEWAKWSDREIAKRCGVSQPFVSDLRGWTASDNGYQMRERTAFRDGKAYEIKTDTINAPVQTVEGREVQCKRGFHVEIYHGDDLEISGETWRDGMEIELEDGLTIARIVEQTKQLKQREAEIAELQKEAESKRLEEENRTQKLRADGEKIRAEFRETQDKAKELMAELEADSGIVGQLLRLWGAATPEEQEDFLRKSGLKRSRPK